MKGMVSFLPSAPIIQIVPVSSAINNRFDPSGGSEMTSGAIILSAINCRPGVFDVVSTTGGGSGGAGCGGVYELFFLQPKEINKRVLMKSNPKVLAKSFISSN